MPTLTNEPNHDIVYSLIKKAKHTKKPRDISYYRQDFDDKTVEKNELIELLQYTMDKGYLKCEIVNGASASQSGDEAPFAVCQNGQITKEGLNLLRADFFRI